jgi:hypothetical protein
VIVTDKFAVCVLLAESVTFTVKLTLPAVGELPERTPPLDRLNPTLLRVPEVTVHV